MRGRIFFIEYWHITVHIIKNIIDLITKSNLMSLQIFSHTSIIASLVIDKLRCPFRYYSTVNFEEHRPLYRLQYNIFPASFYNYRKIIN